MQAKLLQLYLATRLPLMQQKVLRGRQPRNTRGLQQSVKGGGYKYIPAARALPQATQPLLELAL
eukprot:scaffold3305_cov122-Skeletonema_menzelii.AAC.1